MQTKANQKSKAKATPIRPGKEAWLCIFISKQTQIWYSLLRTVDSNLNVRN